MLEEVSHADEPPGGVIAVLGPTNTGKTHRAIERMLEFESGMMGLPLRLLAREVYDRVTTRLGEQAVALVTGEEKRVPPRARYWICTVEAMPRELAVEFVAVDEIQLIAHPERGHVFTDRLLFWRGSRETWFMGAGSVERLMRSWLPDVRVRKLPRLSQLTHTGVSSMRTLPRRSAAVAFSLPQVYELADLLRARRGGAAVVVGALSPRVRNAQVALYQSGEVDFLVATDAIGMGLNLDIDHVALAGRTKFDGFEIRELETPELAQIVGRAGRHLRDGSFGTLAPEPELSPRIVEQLEQHRFPSLKHAFYRNAELDFSTVPALIASLEKRPPAPGLVIPPDADDLLVLRVLAKKPEIMALANAPERVRVLWDVCRIPNYEKRIPEHQAERLVPLFIPLAQHGELEAEYVERELSRLARLEGDIHQLMDRLAGVRTWTYVSHQAGWVPDGESFRARARELEDKLGDLLHERLLERFVAVQGARGRTRKPSDARAAAEERGSPFAKLADLELYGAAERSRERERQQWVEELVEAPFEALELDAHAELTFRGTRLGRLAQGPTLLRPTLKLALPEWLPAGSHARVERRLAAHTRDLLAYLLEPVAFWADSAPLRGLTYQLQQGLGTVDAKSARAQIDALSEGDRALLATHDIVVGRHSVYAQDLLTPRRRALRFALCRAAAPDARSFDRTVGHHEELVWQTTRGLDAATLLALGYVPVRNVAVRCDVLERLVAETGTSPDERLERAEALLDTGRDTAELVLRALATKKRRRRRGAPRASS
jgi:ATP-dependent RNA helicase SUPV3L1/SUV3